jgi:endonuclease/exonuclease/phosphatase (EEP) superfamily protein YafD
MGVGPLGRSPSQGSESAADHGWTRSARPTRSVWRHRATALLMFFGVVVLLATATAPLLARHWWVAELLANLPIQHALLFAVLLVAAGLLRHRGLTGLAALGLLVNLAISAPVLIAIQRGDAGPATGAPTVDVTFFNAKYGTGSLQMIEYLRERDDDVVVLSLVSGGVADQIDMVAGGDLTVRAGPGRGRDGDLTMIALVRDPDATVTVHRPTDDPRDAVIEVTVDLDGQPVRVLATHPVSPLTPTRAAQRNRTLERIAAHALTGNEPIVVMGDLNATPWSPYLQELLATADLIDSQVGHGMQPSFPASRGWLGLAIDHVLHGPELRTVERQLGPAFGSDHRMLHARLTWSQETDDQARANGPTRPGESAQP